jgi:hypothetical protein
MLKSMLKGSTIVATLALTSTTAFSDGHATTYGPFPITLQNYDGDATNSVSYSGQIARHVLHDSLKVLAGRGDGGANAIELEAQMLAYFSGSDDDLPIIAPVSKTDFFITQTTVNEISSGKNIEGKFYNGAMLAWPGAMAGRDVALHMINRAASANAGFDATNGYDFGQLISKFTMGAMAYNQAVDNYLDEKLEAGNKPNDAPYGDGTAYTGKEHSWDEGFGYFGAPAHALALTADQAYDVSKRTDVAAADANGDGAIDLKSEMVFGPAYYAAAFDRSGTKSTSYLPNIMQAYVDGRMLITSAEGAALTNEQRTALQAYAATIEMNWEQVLAEAVFKYAGTVYSDIAKMQADGADEAETYRDYVKHWGELKGFSMSLQTGRNNLGETAVMLNELILFGPVTLDNSYVTGVDADGSFLREKRMTWNDYQLHMLQVQQLMVGAFGVTARANDQLADLAGLAEKLGEASSSETD